MPLFQWGDFTLHSGDKSWWRIDCDALTDSEIELFAKIMSDKAGAFCYATCPTSHPGSAAPKLVSALEKYSTHKSNDCVLIVDDVLTTGRSMNDIVKKLGGPDWGRAKGAVIFARGKCPEWISPIFQGEF